MNKRVLIIGAGPGDIETALNAAPYTESVMLISAGPVADWGQLLSTTGDRTINDRRRHTVNQIEFYQHKLDYETDSYDVHEALQNGIALVVIDARSEEAYRESHIPGALNLPHRAMDKSTTANLDRDALYVTYCDGIGCNASTRGALKMTQLGFKVKELLGGIDWWRRDGYPIEGEGGEANCGC